MALKVLEPLYGGVFRTSGEGSLPLVLPGEVVDCGQVVEASADRVAPACVHFGECGGCQYQHASYPAQLGIKLQIIEGIFAEAGLKVPPIETVSGKEYGYRNRIRLRVEKVEGELRVGYSRRGSNDFMPIGMCSISAPLLLKAAKTVLDLAHSDAKIGTFVRSFGIGTRYIELFTTADESKLQILFYLAEEGVVKGTATGFAAMCDRLHDELPQLTGAGAILDPELPRGVRRRWEGVAWGAPGLLYRVGGLSYWVSRGAFFQVNRFLVERLVEIVTDGQRGTLAWDLFAGVGLFSRVLAEWFDRVVAVEGGEAAAADLRSLGKGEFVAVESAALDFLRAQERQRERPELVVLDPPRAGLGVEGAEILARMQTPRVVYVSCDPVTLARDLEVLVRGGYGIERVTLLDLFPQTFHMEAVVVLRAGTSA